ncbi:hypothetical protein BDN67DRAFT_917680, partial [Paxillus ammoniavirescens]
PNAPLTIFTDSRYAMDGLTKHLPSWEDDGWIGVANSEWFKAAAYHLRTRAAPTYFKWTKGHARTRGNEEADRLANIGAQKPQANNIEMAVPDAFNMQGAKLETITQSMAYQGIKERKSEVSYKRSTLMNLDIACHAIHAISGYMETDQTIWENCRHADIRKPAQQFLFCALHHSHRIGDFWTNIPTYEHRSKCSACHDTTETLEHILLECPSRERKAVWELTKNLWPTDYGDWPTVNIGTILGCGSLNLPPTTQQQPGKNALTPAQRGASWLLRILISEAAHLIWAIRCERVIRGTTCTQEVITKRWLHKINHRLQMDCQLGTIRLRHPSPKQKVTLTWQKVISSPSDIPSDWATNLEVLVGINLPRPSVVRGHRAAHRVPHTP